MASLGSGQDIALFNRISAAYRGVPPRLSSSKRIQLFLKILELIPDRRLAHDARRA